ncbi:MAG TPA: hypothetical protein VFN29_11095 [Chiayiivirga sp.]|nr:hypothetical protein [Chiayiivirga sp.]
MPVLLDAGQRFSCAIRNGGEVWCWGENSHGNLGDGTTTSRALAQPVKSPDGLSVLSGVIDLATGDHHACALGANGSVWCWGSNAAGQLGDNSWDNRSRPIQVKGVGGTGVLTGMTDITAGGQHTCASNGTSLVVCWGSNDSGQLGNANVSSTDSSLVPIQVMLVNGQALLNIASVAAGESQTCGLKNDGTVWCWGSNRDGELGDGQGGPNALWTPAPTQVMALGESPQSLGGIVQITAGARHTCALAGDGGVWCWGANWSGQTGSGQSGQNLRAMRVLDEAGQGYLSDVMRVDAGAWHTCAQGLAGGSVALWCWGENFHGQLGKSIGAPSQWPVRVVDSSGQGQMASVGAIAAGTSHSCAMTGTGNVWCWGQDTDGQLGNGNFVSRLLPSRAGSSGGSDIWTGASMVSAGGYHSCALDGEHTVWCWGLNSNGQLGDGSSQAFGWSAVPRHVSDASGQGVLSTIAEVDTGEEYSCALSDAGAVWCWGSNYQGQLGDGSTTPRSRPVQVLGLPDIRHLALGARHACAIAVDGALWCWGENGSGQLGDGSTTDRTSALPVQGLSGVTEASAGYKHTCAIASGMGVSSGVAWCWGDNAKGQLGSGNTASSTVPAVVRDSTGQSFLGDMLDISAAEGHTCAHGSDARAWCWGDNERGQLGDGSSTSHSLPSLVRVGPDAQSVPLATRQVAAGSAHSCALTPTGEVRCWGGNSYGELGTGSDKPELWPAATRAASGVAAISDVSQVSSGNSHNCGLVGTGSESQIWCWGYNDYGQLGRAPGTDRWQNVIWGGGAGVGAIAINPTSVAVSQSPGSQTQQTVVISNTGSGELIWAIDPYRTSAALYDNGPFMTHPGQGFNGADVSAIASSLGNTTLGFTGSPDPGQSGRVADDFMVPASGWHIEYATLWAFQYEVPPPSILNSVTLQIWDGVPGAPGSEVVFGDETSNRFVGTQFTGIYRASDQNFGWSSMPIMSIVADLGVDLPAGDYWLDWQIGAATTGSINHFFVTSPNSQGKTGANARWLAGSNWQNVIDYGSNVAQDIPFALWGSDPNTPQCTALADAPWLSIDVLEGNLAPGASSDLVLGFDSSGLAPGSYEARLCILSTDLNHPITILPIQLNVGAHSRISVTQGTLLLPPSNLFPYSVYEIALSNASDADPASGVVIATDAGTLLRSSRNACSTDANGVVTCAVPSAGQVACDASGHSCTLASLPPGGSVALALTLADGQCATVSIPPSLAEAGHDSIHVCAN